MTELTDLNDTDALNTEVTSQSTVGNTANMGGMDNLFQATLGMLSRFRNSNIFRLRDNTDKTKLLAFDLSGLTTATTRTVTVPDASGTLQYRVSSTDNAVTRWSGTLGEQQDSSFFVDDSGNVSSFGGQIKFPGTQAASTDANTLDDYEEGSSIFLAAPTSGSFNNAATILYYVKIGRWVWVGGELDIINNGTGAVAINCTMPFTSSAPISPFSGIKLGTGIIQAFLPANSSQLSVALLDGSYAGGTGAKIYFSGFYRTAS